MAVRNGVNSKLVLQVETGMKADGTPVYAQRVFQHLNPALTDEDLLAVGNALGAFSAYPLGKVMRQETAEITE